MKPGCPIAGRLPVKAHRDAPQALVTNCPGGYLTVLRSTTTYPTTSSAPRDRIAPGQGESTAPQRSG